MVELIHQAQSKFSEKMPKAAMLYMRCHAKVWNYPVNLIVSLI